MLYAVYMHFTIHLYLFPWILDVPLMLQCHSLALFGRSGDAWSPLEVKRSNWKRGTGNLLGNAPFQLGQTYLGDSSIYIIYIYINLYPYERAPVLNVLKNNVFFSHTSSFKLQWMSSPPCGFPP